MKWAQCIAFVVVGLCAEARAFTTTVKVVRASMDEAEIERDDNHERFEVEFHTIYCDFATRNEVSKVGATLLYFNSKAFGDPMDYDSTLDEAALFLLNSDSSGLGLSSIGPVGRCGVSKVQKADLTGCCSFHKGVEQVDNDGRVRCNDMTYSRCSASQYNQRDMAALKMQMKQNKQRLEDLKAKYGSPKAAP